MGRRSVDLNESRKSPQTLLKTVGVEEMTKKCHFCERLARGVIIENIAVQHGTHICPKCKAAGAPAEVPIHLCVDCYYLCFRLLNETWHFGLAERVSGRFLENHREQDEARRRIVEKGGKLTVQHNCPCYDCVMIPSWRKTQPTWIAMSQSAETPATKDAPPTPESFRSTKPGNPKKRGFQGLENVTHEYLGKSIVFVGTPHKKF
jgi:hypothetical protein